MENPKRRSQWWTWWFKWWIIAAAFVLVILIHSEPPQLWFWLVLGAFCLQQQVCEWPWLPQIC